MMQPSPIDFLTIAAKTDDIFCTRRAIGSDGDMSGTRFQTTRYEQRWRQQINRMSDNRIQTDRIPKIPTALATEILIVT